MPGKVVWGVLLALLVGCEERERLVFETDPTDQDGPVTRIDPPSRDTTISEGAPFQIGARTVDTSGVDTVYIEVEGAGVGYQPLHAEGVDTVDFSINLPTLGLAGQTVTVRMYGVDVIGNVGLTVVRRLTIQ
jgi:hypothetical protein